MRAKSFRVNRPDVIDEHFDEEYVLVNLRTGMYYSLNRPAADVWDLVIQNVPRASILAQMERAYDADAAQIEHDLDRLLMEWEQEQLIVPLADELRPVTLSPGHTTGPRRAYLSPHTDKYTDMQALLLLDPIHQVDESGWPATKPNVD